MMKTLIALVPIMVLCAGQATNLTNSAVLDPAGNFKISWEPLTAYGDIVIQLQAKSPGWLSLLIASPDGTYADLIWGGYINSTDTGYLQDMHFDLTSDPLGHTAPLVDASQDLILQGAIYHEPWTIVRVKRSLVTGDADDVAIENGVYTLGWSYSDSNDASVPHTAAGFAELAFIP